METVHSHTEITCRVCLGSFADVVIVFYVHEIPLIEEITYVAHTAEFLCYHDGIKRIK